MKKFVQTLLMLACVFALTACGSEEAMSDLQKTKVDTAQSRATQVIDLTTLLVTSDDVDAMVADYNNVELGDLFTSTYMQYTGDTSFVCDGKAVKTALTSFASGLEDMGSVKEYGTPESVVDGDTIVVTVPVTGETASGSVELIFTNDIYLKMTACTLNMDETMGQLMTKAALNTLLGMGTVFIVLILISVIISLFGFIPKIQASFAKPQKEAGPTPPPAPAAPPVVEEEEELSDDTELVAVLAAAIAAYEGTSVEGFQVRSIRRARTNKWQKG